jgi:hypothetical protein
VSGEDEREVTRDREAADTDGDEEGPVEDRAEQVSEGVREIDDAADSFLEVEQALDTMADGMQVRGQAIDVERISATEVPEEFPSDVGTGDALALTLELDETEGKTATTYFGWPGETPDERLGKLLQLCEVSPDRFADLHGEDILLEVEDGHVVPVLPREEPRGDDRAYWGILAGLVPSLLIFVGGLVDAGGFLFTQTFVLVWLLATFVGLPVSIYLDAWNLRTTTNWRGGPLFWAFFSMIPVLNIMAVAAYLVLRQNAEPIR